VKYESNSREARSKTILKLLQDGGMHFPRIRRGTYIGVIDGQGVSPLYIRMTVGRKTAREERGSRTDSVSTNGDFDPFNVGMFPLEELGHVMALSWTIMQRIERQRENGRLGVLPYGAFAGLSRGRKDGFFFFWFGSKDRPPRWEDRLSDRKGRPVTALGIVYDPGERRAAFAWRGKLAHLIRGRRELYVTRYFLRRLSGPGDHRRPDGVGEGQIVTFSRSIMFCRARIAFPG